MLGLPDPVVACLFDLDGVLTDTASVHQTAWKSVFDQLLKQRGLPEFTPDDYGQFVDGKRREDGVRDFLASRSIVLPEGATGDQPSLESVAGISARKNEVLLAAIARDGVTVYEGSRRYLQACAEHGLRRAVVSSSANTKAVLDVTGLAPLVELRVDGVTAAEQHLKGKPAPDTFLAAAHELGLEPSQCAVFEDALAGVQAGRAGKFGYVVGVDRVGHGPALLQHGATVVVQDLEELL